MRIGSILAVLALLLAGCSTRFAELAAVNQLEPGEPSSGFGVTFFGTSTLLVEDGETQILVDGFMTRVRHRLVRKIKPSERQIARALTAHGICPNPELGALAARSGFCAARPERGLSIVIPAHAHYDHALDSSYIAAWAGARLVADASVRATFEATRKLEWAAPMHWDAVQMVPPFEKTAQDTRHFEAGLFRITLIRSEHLENPFSKLAGPLTGDSLTLPAQLWEFGEGTTLSIRIEKGGRSILIVPSAGTFSNGREPDSLQSDVVFMGIGGLGWKSAETTWGYWQALVDATAARRVIPIHWDNDQFETAPGATSFPLASPRRFDATLAVFEKLAGKNRIEIIFAPPLQRFDPFQGLE
jgi:L-ascorbate metabolism protein UlaG (beta-lactamase superfamily)